MLPTVECVLQFLGSDFGTTPSYSEREQEKNDRRFRDIPLQRRPTSTARVKLARVVSLRDSPPQFPDALLASLTTPSPVDLTDLTAPALFFGCVTPAVLRASARLRLCTGVLNLIRVTAREAVRVVSTAAAAAVGGGGGIQGCGMGRYGDRAAANRSGKEGIVRIWKGGQANIGLEDAHQLCLKRR